MTLLRGFLKDSSGLDRTIRTKGDRENKPLSTLTAFGLFAVTAMLVFYALEKRSRWFILAFAASCLMGSIYGFLQGAWPFGLVESVWALVALRRWWAEKNVRRLDSNP